MTSTTSSPKSLLLVKAADSADFGEGRNQPETLRFCDPSDPWTPWTSSFPAVAAVRLSSLTPYHLVMTNSLPWEDPPFLRTVNHLFLWAIYTMAMLVIIRGYLQMPHSGLIGPDLGDSTEAPRKYCSWKPQDLIHWGLTTTILQL